MRKGDGNRIPCLKYTSRCWFYSKCARGIITVHQTLKSLNKTRGKKVNIQTPNKLMFFYQFF